MTWPIYTLWDLSLWTMAISAHWKMIVSLCQPPRGIPCLPVQLLPRPSTLGVVGSVGGKCSVTSESIEEADETIKGNKYTGNWRHLFIKHKVNPLIVKITTQYLQLKTSHQPTWHRTPQWRENAGGFSRCEIFHNVSRLFQISKLSYFKHL